MPAVDCQPGEKAYIKGDMQVEKTSNPSAACQRSLPSDLCDAQSACFMTSVPHPAYSMSCNNTAEYVCNT
jgi:hypothetical protein